MKLARYFSGFPFIDITRGIKPADSVSNCRILYKTGFRALKAVIPGDILLIPVGGINEDNWIPYLSAGATACGLGSSLYKAGMSSEELAQRAAIFSISWEEGKGELAVLPDR